METNLDEAEERRRAGIPAIVRAILPRNLWENPLNWKRTKFAMGFVVMLITATGATAAVTGGKKATSIEGIQMASLPSGAKSQPVSFNSNQQQANQQSAFRVAFNELVRETSGRLFEFKFNEKENKLYATPLHVTAAYLNKDIPEFYQVSSMTGGITLGGVGASMNMGSLYNEENFKCNQNPPGSPKFKHCRSRLIAIQLDTLARQANVVLSFVDTKESLAREEEKYDEFTRANLKSFYLDCLVYWVENEPGSPCNPTIISRYEGHTFIPIKDITITIIDGSENTFTAIARHTKSSKAFKIDAHRKVEKEAYREVELVG